MTLKYIYFSSICGLKQKTVLIKTTILITTVLTVYLLFCFVSRALEVNTPSKCILPSN